MCMLPLFALRRIAEAIPFLPPFFLPPEISLFWGSSIAITPSKTRKALPTPMKRKYSIGSSHLTSSPSMTSTYLLFSIIPLAVTPPLTRFSKFNQIIILLATFHCPNYLFLTRNRYKHDASYTFSSSFALLISRVHLEFRIKVQLHRLIHIGTWTKLFRQVTLKSNNLYGSGSGRIFALPLPQEKNRFRFQIPHHCF